jgi:hypothetical protein
MKNDVTTYHLYFGNGQYKTLEAGTDNATAIEIAKAHPYCAYLVRRSDWACINQPMLLTSEVVWRRGETDF